MRISKFLLTASFVMLIAEGLCSCGVPTDGIFDLVAATRTFRSLGDYEREVMGAENLRLLHCARVQLNAANEAGLSPASAQRGSATVAAALDGSTTQREAVARLRVLEDENQRITSQSIADLRQRDQRVSELQQESALLSEQKRSADVQLSLVRDELQKLRETKQQIGDDAIRQAQDSVAVKEDQCRILTERNKRLEAELTRVGDELRQANDKRVAAESRCVELELEKSKSASQLRQVTDALLESKRKISDLEAAMAQLRAANTSGDVLSPKDAANCQLTTFKRKARALILKDFPNQSAKLITSKATSNTGQSVGDFLGALDNWVGGPAVSAVSDLQSPVNEGPGSMIQLHRDVHKKLTGAFSQFLRDHAKIDGLGSKYFLTNPEKHQVSVAANSPFVDRTLGGVIKALSSEALWLEGIK